MITEKKMHRYQRMIIGLCLILSMISACSPAQSVEKEIENNPEPEPTATLVVLNETEEIIDEPTPILDVSEWIITVGGLECTLVPYEDEFPGWYTLACPEQLWFPIGQTTTIEINLLDSETCTVSPIDDFEVVIQDISSDALPVEFVHMDEGGWGCQIPYSDTAGTEVACGLEVDCEGIGEEIKVIIKGKTIRFNMEGSSGSSDESDNWPQGGDEGSGGGEVGGGNQDE